MSEPATKLQQSLDQMAALLNEGGTWPDDRARFLDLLGQCGEEAMAAGFPGLLDLCLVFRDCLAQWLEASGQTADPMDLSVLASWPGAVNDYLRTPATDEAKDSLIQIVSYPAWGKLLGTDDAAMLKQLLDIQLGGVAHPASTELDVTALPENTKTPESVDAEHPALNINDSLPAQTLELVTIMATELLNIRAAIQQTCALLSSTPAPDHTRLQQPLHEIAQMLEFYGDAANSVDFQGLGDITTVARENLIHADAADTGGLLAQLQLLLEWSAVVLDYLQNPVDPANSETLLAFMRSDRWPLPLDDEQARTCAAILPLRPTTTIAAEKPARPLHAGPDDVSLVLPEDVDQDLLEAMLQELPAQSEELSAALQRLGDNGNLDDILLAKRIAHTLKGAGNTVGIRGIATLTHYMEDILLALHKQEIMPPPRIMRVLANAADCLAIMSESLLGLGEPPEDAQAILQEVLDLANTIDQQGIPVDGPESTATPAERVPRPVNDEGVPETRSAGGERDVIPMLRLPATFVDGLLRLIGENKIVGRQIDNFIEDTLGQLQNMQDCFGQLKQLGDKVQELTDVKDLSRVRQHNRATPYDTLEMDHFTELHTYSKWLAETTVDAWEINQDIASNLLRLRNLLSEQARLNNETQDNVMRARMLRADTHFQRLQRCVRQAAKLTGKPAHLHLQGAEVLLDSETLNALLDPLMHLLRNAVDHGIEPAVERLAQGKPETGNITLSFGREGNNILVQCRDDGRGLDLENIRRKAIEQGLIDAEQTITDTELKQFILRPLFSTKQETTQVSGRGIGMDAVYASISALSGSMSLDSTAGQGCTIDIRLPRNMLSIFALLIRTGPRLMVISSRDIVRIVHHENGKLYQQGDAWIFKTGNQEHPVLNFEDLLYDSGDRRAQARLPRSAILYRTETGTTAVMVEKILGSGDFVVKEPGDYVPKLPGIPGVTLLGDGTVAPVLDIGELLRQPRPADGEKKYMRADYVKPKLPVALVVDDSLSARRALTQFMQDAGFDVRQARDGLEAMDIISTQVPDILLSDLEMPRMNGLELTGHLRARAETADLPIIMITSRAAAKHREEALVTGVNVYLTKPYTEDELMDEIRKLHRPGNVPVNA